jgi:hypothetical protein
MRASGSPSLPGAPPPVDARDNRTPRYAGLIVPAIAPRTYAATSVGSMEENDIKQACSRSSCSVESASRSSSRATGRGRCNQRKRISAARGSVTARSRRPRSISSSLGAFGQAAWRDTVRVPAKQASMTLLNSRSSIKHRVVKPLCKRSSSARDRPSSSTSPTSSLFGLCNHRSKISAARGSVTARSLRPRSMSASVGGSLCRRSERWPACAGVLDSRGVPPPARRV